MTRYSECTRYQKYIKNYSILGKVLDCLYSRLYARYRTRYGLEIIFPYIETHFRIVYNPSPWFPKAPLIAHYRLLPDRLQAVSQRFIQIDLPWFFRKFPCQFRPALWLLFLRAIIAFHNSSATASSLSDCYPLNLSIRLRVGCAFFNGPFRSSSLCFLQMKCARIA